ncbi:hypothetical protein QL285_001189 [Trifolium repens]|nr:hypothetical protein QL285_001189 [Trifolium repens]
MTVLRLPHQQNILVSHLYAGQILYPSMALRPHDGKSKYSNAQAPYLKPAMVIQSWPNTNGWKRMKLALERALFKVCSGKDKGECIDEDKLKELTDQWKGEEWQNISKINTQNRKSKAGHNVHSGGSISAKEHAKTMRVELNREPTCFEVYQRMHKPKEKSNEWFNEEQALIAVCIQLILFKL